MRRVRVLLKHSRFGGGGGGGILEVSVHGFLEMGVPVVPRSAPG